MSEFADRRRALMKSFEGGVVVLASAPVAIRNNDVEHEFRQDSDLYYLSGFDEPDSVLVLTSAHAQHRTVLFVRPRDVEREQWDGPRAGVQGAPQQCGIDAAFPISELDTRLPEYLIGHDRLLHRFGVNRAFDDKLIRALDVARSRARRGTKSPVHIDDPAVVLHEMRLVKSRAELESMRRAGQITGIAHEAAMRASKPGQWEYELEALYREVFRRHGSERPAYAPIVGSGPNATILHYRANRRQMQDGDLVLVDAACEYDYYAADVTRTWPVNGKFTEAQRAIYDVVLRAQFAGIQAVRPGATQDDVHRACVEIVLDGLTEHGILSGDRAELREQEKHKPYFMHRASHWLGMDVHDVGMSFVQGKPRPFEPGMVLTVEPGLYFGPSDERVPERFRGIGIRIEDDVIVTAEGRDVLTEQIPKAIDDLERICGRG